MDTKLYEVAQRQHGLITRRQALEHDLTFRQVRRKLASGDWLALEHDVYRLAGAPSTWASGLLAALLTCPGPAAASHAAAMRLHGVRGYADAAPEIVVIGGSLPIVRGAAVHRTRALEPCDVVELDGIRVTSGARSLVDMAARLDRLGLTALVDEVIWSGVAYRQWVYRRSRRLENGRPGVGTVCRLTAPGAEAEFRSWLERLAAAAYRLHGLPQARWNVPVIVDGQTVAVIDVLFEQWGLAVELDGLRFHSSPRARQRDNQRQNLLSLRGLMVLRYTWQEVTQHPELMVAQIRQALANRGVSTK